MKTASEMTYTVSGGALNSTLTYPFRIRPLNTARESGECCKPQPTNDLYILESKNAVLVAAVFVDFSENKCNFLHENKLDIVRRYRLYH